MNLLEDKEFLDFRGMEEQALLVQIADIADEIENRFTNGVSHYGEKLPWEKTHDLVRLRPGEVSLWAGVNGHGKSLVLGQVMCWLPQSQKLIIASLEMPPAATAGRMCQQTFVGGRPTRAYINQFAAATDNIWIYAETRTVETQRIIALCLYAGEKMGINHVMIDSLVKCGIKTDDYNKQKDFVDALCQLAKTYRMHIHLVHHIRKGDKEGREPDKFDVKGAGEITDLVDNVFIVRRNKEKERKIETKQQVKKLEPDAELICVKQRHGEWEGKINLYFDAISQQFTSGPDHTLRWRI